jgi:hypothetical protein
MAVWLKITPSLRSVWWPGFWKKKGWECEIHCRFTPESKRNSMTLKYPHSPDREKKLKKWAVCKENGDRVLGLLRPPVKWIVPPKTTIGSVNFCNNLGEVIKWERPVWLTAGEKYLLPAFQWSTLFECTSEVLSASVLVKYFVRVF